MKKITKNTLYLALLLFLTTACYEDKGNYDYSEVPEITAEGLPEQVTLLQKADVLSIAPPSSHPQKESSGRAIRTTNSAVCYTYEADVCRTAHAILTSTKKENKR